MPGSLPGPSTLPGKGPSNLVIIQQGAGTEDPLLMGQKCVARGGW